MEKLDCLPLYEDANFYDLEFGTRSFDLEFYQKRSLRAGGPVLELACGSGRITLPIAQAGVAITGLDVVQPMIEKAREKAQKLGLSVPFFCDDARTFSLGRKFKLIFAAANSLQHLHSAESVMALLNRSREHLLPDGRLIIDVFNPDLEKLLRPKSQRYLHKEFRNQNGALIRVEAESEYLAASQILRFDLFYSEPPAKPFLTKHVTMRCFYPLELDYLCESAGFGIEEKMGSYDGSRFQDQSGKQILVLKSKV